MPFESGTDYGDDVFKAVEKAGKKSLAEAHQIVDKTERNAADKAAVAAIVESLGDTFEGREREVKSAIKSLTKKIIRQRVVNEGVRIDGRGVKDLRPVSCEVGLMPTAHGTGLFQRGETQVLNVLHPRHAPHGPDARHAEPR